MTSALDLINDAATFAGLGDLQNGLSAEESALALRLLNNLLDAESTQEYSIYNVTLGQIPQIVGTQAYLLGPGGTTILVNPTMVFTVTTVDSSGFTHPMREVGQDEWANIRWQSQPGRPAAWFYDQGAPNSTMNVWPTPTFVGDVTNIWYGTALQQFASLSSVLVAPAGFEMFLKTSLGGLLAAWFRKALSPEQLKMIKTYREFVRDYGIPLLVLDLDVPSDSLRYYYNIYTDNQ